jgi:hypothetical protein
MPKRQRGRTGAFLLRIDVHGEQPIRLTEPQLELLDGAQILSDA